MKGSEQVKIIGFQTVVAYTKPQHRKKEEREQLREERDKVKFIDLRLDLPAKELCQKIDKKLSAYSRRRPFMNKENAEKVLTCHVKSFGSFVAKLLKTI